MKIRIRTLLAIVFSFCAFPLLRPGNICSCEIQSGQVTISIDNTTLGAVQGAFAQLAEAFTKVLLTTYDTSKPIPN